jgi:hypothetical protein
MEPSQNPQPSQNDTDELGTAQQPTVAPNPGQYPGQNMPQVVQVMRPLNPMAQEIPEDIKRRCEESKHKYPHLNLSPGEFVIDSVAVFTTSIGGGTMVSGAATSILLIGALLLAVFFVLGGIIATYIYNSNHFYLTNESVIQEIMFSLFSRNVQTVSLSNIEDASFRQNGILPHLLNYGDIRLSTEGDETTYRFSYVANPNQHIARLNNAVEAFKNGRPIPYSTDDQPS